MPPRRGCQRQPFLPALLAFLTTLLPAAGCAASPSDARSAGLGESFALKVGEAVSIEGESLQVGFLEVSGDSRCPKGEQCVWEGDAIVRIWVQRNAGAKENRDLHTSKRESDAASDGGHAVRLLALDPQPTAGRTIDQRDYVATLQVTRE